MTELENIINNSKDYVAVDIDKYIVDGIAYTGYGDYTFTWEKTFVKQPERSSNGSMGNLDTYSTFKTPRMKVTYSFMPISSFRSMMKQYLDKNEFTVTCYDTIYEKPTTNKMYFATMSEPKYYYRVEDNKQVELLGVENYTVELVGTNNI